MYQAGIKQVKLYENNGISYFHYDPLNKQNITHLESLGTVVTLDNLQQPSLKIKTGFTNSGKLSFKYELKFIILGFDLDNLELLNQLKRSIYGWCVDVELYDGTHRFVNTVLLCRESEIEPSKEMVFEMEMSNAIASLKMPLNYVPGVSELTVYRADTTILRADNTIYTADYAL